MILRKVKHLVVGDKFFYPYENKNVIISCKQIEIDLQCGEVYGRIIEVDCAGTISNLILMEDDMVSMVYVSQETKDV